MEWHKNLVFETIYDSDVHLCGFSSAIWNNYPVSQRPRDTHLMEEKKKHKLEVIGPLSSSLLGAKEDNKLQTPPLP